MTETTITNKSLEFTKTGPKELTGKEVQNITTTITDNQVVSYYATLPEVVYQVAGYAGVWEALGIVLTALGAGQALSAAKQLKIRS